MPTPTKAQELSPPALPPSKPPTPANPSRSATIFNKIWEPGEGKNFFSREKKFFPSPRPPSSFQKKRGIFLLVIQAEQVLICHLKLKSLSSILSIWSTRSIRCLFVSILFLAPCFSSDEYFANNLTKKSCGVILHIV